MSCNSLVGIDLLEIDRMERALRRHPKLAERLFTADEISYAERQARPAQHFAARFCAKEAATKALRMEIFRPLESEVVADPVGAPTLRFTGKAAARVESLKQGLSCSLTHSKALAGAVVAGC